MIQKRRIIDEETLKWLEANYRVIPLGKYIIVENVHNLFKLYLHPGYKLIFTKNKKQVIIISTTVQNWFDYFIYYSVFDVVRAEQELIKEDKSLSIDNIYKKLQQRKDLDYEQTH